MRRFLFLLAASIAMLTNIQAYDGNCAPNDCCNFDIGVKASYLYWGVQADQLAFAIERTGFLNEATDPVAQGTIKSHKPHYNSGVRLETFIYSDCFPVGASFQWTGFQSTSTAAAKSNQDEFPEVAVTTVSTILQNGSPFLMSQNAKSKWKVDLNEFALDLYYSFTCCPCVTLRPYVGVIGAGIEQKQNVAYNGVLLNNGEVTTDISVSRTNDFCGVGPRIGLAFQWEFCNNISLITNANAAYLVGKIKMKNRIHSPEEYAGNFIDINETVHRNRPMASGLIGIEWNDKFCGCYGVSLGVSYEYQYWWQQWRSASNMLSSYITGDGQWGDLSFHGLVVTGGVSF